MSKQTTDDEYFDGADDSFIPAVDMNKGVSFGDQSGIVLGARVNESAKPSEAETE